MQRLTMPAIVTRLALVAAGIAAMLLATAVPAFAHVPFLEPAGVVSSARGPANDPFPDAVAVGSPEVSRAIYGFLGPGDAADVYRFAVKSTVTVPVGILVPVGPGAATFRPELTVYGNDKPLGMFDRSGSPRQTFYEPFSQMMLLRGPSAEVTFAPGRDYYLIVTPGKGATQTGRYVVSMGTVEAFSLQDTASAPLEIARIKAGDYGGAPADWSWAIPWGIGITVLLVAAVGLVVWAVRRRRRIPDSEAAGR